MFLGSVLRFTGQSMVSIFLFVYCYQLGFSLEIILAYMIWLSLVSVAINQFLAGRIINRLGPQGANGVSNLFLIAFTLGLYSLGSSLWHLMGLAVLQVFTMQLYYIAQHVFLLQSDGAQEGGRQTGQLFSAEPLGYALGPIVGGLVSWLVSPKVSIGLGVIILVVAGALMFQSTGWRRRGPRHRIDHSQMRAIYRHLRQSWRLTTVAVAHGADFFVFAAWTLWLGVVLAGDVYGLVGITQFIGAALGFAVSQWAGRQVDRGRSQQLMRISGVMNLGLGLIRWVATALASLGLKLMVGLYSLFDWTAYELRAGNIYEQTRRRAEDWRHHQVAYCIAFENLLDLGRAGFAALALAISLLTTSDSTALIIIFLVGTGLSLGFFLRFTPKERRQPAA